MRIHHRQRLDIGEPLRRRPMPPLGHFSLIRFERLAKEGDGGEGGSRWRRTGMGEGPLKELHNLASFCQNRCLDNLQVYTRAAAIVSSPVSKTSKTKDLRQHPQRVTKRLAPNGRLGSF